MTDTSPKDYQTTASKLTDKGQYWLNHLQQCQASGQSMAAYARSQGLGLNPSIVGVISYYHHLRR